jgi:hypothetical protein
MADTSSTRSLRREVLLPDRIRPAWAPLAIAASVTCAFACSLLMIRATGLRHRGHGGMHGAGDGTCPAAAAAAVVHQAENAPAPATACRGPVYQSHNGQAEAVFELCPDGDPALLRR